MFNDARASGMIREGGCSLWRARGEPLFSARVMNGVNVEEEFHLSAQNLEG